MLQVCVQSSSIKTALRLIAIGLACLALNACDSGADSESKGIATSPSKSLKSTRVLSHVAGIDSDTYKFAEPADVAMLGSERLGFSLEVSEMLNLPRGLLSADHRQLTLYSHDHLESSMIKFSRFECLKTDNKTLCYFIYLRH